MISIHFWLLIIIRQSTPTRQFLVPQSRQFYQAPDAGVGMVAAGAGAGCWTGVGGGSCWSWVGPCFNPYNIILWPLFRPTS